MEPNRKWHDPIVSILGNLITPDVCCEAEAYDAANRRWYRLHVEPVVRDEEWLSSTVAKHVSEYFASHKAQPPWNVIKTTAAGSPVTFETEPDDNVRRPLLLSLPYGGGDDDVLPTTTLDQLEDLSFMQVDLDRCTWRGKDCFFKRVEFDPGFDQIMAQISITEVLIEQAGLASRCKENMDEVNAELTKRFLIEPILAVVIARPGEHWKPGTVAGLLKPYSGRDLETWMDDESTVPVTVHHLRELVRGVRELKRCRAAHGDIRPGNAVLRRADEGESMASAMVLVDLDHRLDDGYEGDAKALGALLAWCLERSPALGEDAGLIKERVEAAVEALKREDFDDALAALAL